MWILHRLLLLVCVIIWSLHTTCDAETIKVPDFTTTPEEFLDRMAQGIDKGSDRITQSHLDTIHHNEGDFEPEYQITNALDALRKRLVPYMQRAVYIGLAWTIIVLVILWFRLVKASVEGNNILVQDTRDTMITVIVGVVWMTWFYFIIKFILSLIANFTS